MLSKIVGSTRERERKGGANLSREAEAGKTNKGLPHALSH
jgi:hypothetical protein